MKKCFTKVLAAFLIISLFVPIFVLDETYIAMASEVSSALPTKEELLDGYALKPGLDQTLYNDLEIISVEYVDHVIDHNDGSTIPILHCLKVTGTFNEQSVFGGRADWSIYLPPADHFEGRFYQRVYPFNTGNLPDDVKFSFSSGGYQVEYYELNKINGGAIVADISRTIAANYYGLNPADASNPDHSDYIYGYAYGGSGGSPAAIDILEDDTYNTWDGAIPFVITAPYTYPTGGDTIPIFRNLLLRGLGTEIWDAMRVGGIGRDALDAELTPLQKEVVEELELLGLRWEDIGNVGTELTVNGGPTLPPGYVDDFWNKPGYTGTEDSLIGDFFREIRGTTIDNTVMTDELLAKIAWHRHRNFDPTLGLFMYDHLEHLEKAGPVESFERYTGNIQRKGMLIQNMQDGGAIPFSAEWYKRQVESKGKSDNFRVYVQEAAGHWDTPDTSGGDVPYLGLLEQALRDLTAWVEEDKAPADSTGYDVKFNQIYMKETATERHGLQPVINLTANESKRTVVSPGKSITLKAKIETAIAGDVITNIEWNTETSGNTWTDAEFTIEDDGTVTVEMENVYDLEGTYYPGIRVTAYRGGEPTEGIVGRLMNQASVRVLIQVDKTLLQSLYNANKDKSEGDYTETTWRVFNSALKTAEIVLADEEATQEEIDTAEAALKEGIDRLEKLPVEVVDKTSLQSLYDTNKDKLKGDYTEASWTVFNSALTSAKIVLADEEATQEEIGTTEATLKEGIKQLKELSQLESDDKESDQEKDKSATLENEEDEEINLDSGDTNGPNEGSRLPDTATNTANIVLVGLALFLFGSVLLFIYRKKTYLK